MLTLLARRAGAQWRLLLALLGVVTIGATLLGTCALLTTRTAERAFEIAAARAAPEAVDVTAYTGIIEGFDAAAVAAETRGVVIAAVAPFTATTTTRASSVLRALPTGLAAGTTVPPQTYLEAMDALPAQAQLIEGHWPGGAGGPLEAAVLETTARTLGLTVGSRVRLGAELAHAPVPALDVTVVGVVRPLPGIGWDRDSLAAAGFVAGYRDGRYGQPVNVYGPLLVDLAALLHSGATLDRLEVSAHPDLSAPSRRDLDAVAGTVSDADRRLGAALGDRAHFERVSSDLPLTLRAADEQRRVTGAVVLAVAALGAVLAATALALAGRLTAVVRAEETTLLSALGIRRVQLAAAAVVEAGALGLLAAALAIPGSSAVHAGLTHLPPLRGAGLATGPAVTGVQALAVATGALALAALLVLLAPRPTPAVDRHHRRELLARSGIDLLLVAFAAAGWWQLSAQPDGATARVDAVRVLAPALLLTAGAALALRLVVPALRGIDRLARRTRGLIMPLAAAEAARRPHAVAAGLLVALAGATGTFGVAFDATWHRSQSDQAELAVGTDLALALARPPVAGQGAAVAEATGGAVSPAVNRGTAVGQWLGGTGAVPRLVAADTARAGMLLRGRLDGERTWTDVGAALAPPGPVVGVAVPAGATLLLSGTAGGATGLTVTPRLLVQDASGLRTTCTGAALPLDGREVPLPGCAPSDGLRLVAVSLPVSADSAGDVEALAGRVKVAVALTVPPSAGVDRDPVPPWTATSAPPAPGRLIDPTVTIAGSARGTTLNLAATVQLGGDPDAAHNLVATAFPDPGRVPVAVSSRFAEQTGARPGSRLSVTVGTTPVPVVVATVLPTVPGAPGAAAVLADLDTLSRALAVVGDLTYPVDAWWVGRPTQTGAAERATALRLGTVTTRAGETDRLTGGPLRAGLPAALRLLIPAAGLLLLAGVVLHATCDLQLRALEVARLRGLGLSRRDIRGVLFGQHAATLVPLLAAGAIVGALATALVAPLLVRSEIGAAPVPAARPHWPWGAEALLLAALLAGCALAVAAVVAVQIRRADAAHLRVAS
ncbi:FtsX-like permease family protein [Dactylosporangium darangshiense]|uniref:ABC3 transporter permease C-terminal domain-containing protein n=1 Tax=Dactylosporangium darangshiense TaxID=579108 RepID=A0ABP8DTI3_9ACTN